MYLMNLMNQKSMTRSDLSQISGVPDSTLRDILNGKAQIDHCEAATIYNIAEALDTSVEDILENYWEECEEEDDEGGIWQQTLHDGHTLVLFYSLVDQLVQARKDEGDLALADCINSGDYIDQFFSKGFYREAFFLLGLTDYLYRKLGKRTDPRFDAYRDYCLDCHVYSLRTIAACDDPAEMNKARAYAENHAVRELAAFDIYMTKEDISPDD